VAILNIYTGPQNPNCSTSNGYATCPVQTDANIITAVNNELTYSAIAPTVDHDLPAARLDQLDDRFARTPATGSTTGGPETRRSTTST